MTTQWVVALVSIVVVLTAGTAAAFVVGLGPFASSGDSGDVGTFPTETSTPTGVTATPSGGSSGTASGGSGNGGSAGDDGGTGDDAARTRPPFTFRVTGTEKCGRTCRDVTVRLSNNMDRPARDVTVYTRIFAGNSTAKDDRVWQGREDIGRLGSGEAVARTKRVKLGLSEGFAVQRNDGWVTIQTTVQSADRTKTFTERRDVT